MKKFILALSVALLSCISISAQSNIFNNPDNKAYFGLRIGGDITCPSKIKSGNVGVRFFKNGGGIEFGGIYNIPVVANFYIEPGFKLFYNMYSIKKDFVELLQDDIIFNTMSIRKFGMRIPLAIGYHFDFTDDVKVSFFTGPELEIGFSAKEYHTGRYFEISESVYGEDGTLQRVNLLWGIGAGISYRHFYFGLNGGIGMLKMNTEPDVMFHENRVTFSAGYNF